MKALFLSLLTLVPLASMPSLSADEKPQAAQRVEQLRNLNQRAFKPGEVLEYRIRYGLIEAGKAKLEVKGIVERSGRPSYHVVGTGRTTGMTEWFFKTRDRYESFIDTEAMVPWEFIRDVNEGGYEIERHLIFDQYQQTVRDLKALHKGEFSYEEYAQDMISAFYFARSWDASKLKKGDEISFTMFLDHEQFPFKLVVLGRENVETDWGDISCLALRPKLQEGRVFSEEEGMTIYVSDDENKVPILIESSLFIGSIRVELTDYKGLQHKLRFK
tara:strand:- start:437 stop:1255 length:819 start_codon:yes stop_codon:yes gene_type:complete